MYVRNLTSEESKVRDDGIVLATEYLATSAPLSPQDVQLLYEIIAREYPENVKAQMAVGIAFGAMIVSRSGFEWVRIIDEYGEETGLCHPEKIVVCFPISMLQKRITSGDATNLMDLCDATIGAVNDTAANGDYQAR